MSSRPREQQRQPQQQRVLSRWRRVALRAHYWLGAMLHSTVVLAMQGRAHPLRQGPNAEVSDAQSRCPHPPSAVKSRGNQHASWTVCTMCMLRLSYQEGKPEQRRSAASSSSAPTPAPSTAGRAGRARASRAGPEEISIGTPPRHATGAPVPSMAEMATAMATAIQGPLREMASSQQAIVQAIVSEQQTTAQQLSALTSVMLAGQSPGIQQGLAAAFQAHAQQAVPVMGGQPDEDGWLDTSYGDQHMDQR